MREERSRPTRWINRQVCGLLGLPFDLITLDQAVAVVRAAARERRRCFISTPNVNFVVGAQRDAAFRQSVLLSDLSLADGMPIVWIARWLGSPMPGRVAGADLFDRLRRTAGPALTVYFFGGLPGVAARAAAVLNAEGGALRCVGHASPGFGSLDEISSEALIDDINRSGADFLVVSLGAKKGQAWILRNLDRLTPPVVSHLGAVVNFVAGGVSRAPRRWRRSGLEWLWRIKEEPMLWRRYWQDGVGLARLLLQQVVPARLSQWRRAPSAVAPVRIERASATVANRQMTVLRLVGHWTAASLPMLREQLHAAALAGQPVQVDLSATDSLDCSCIGLLLLLDAHQPVVPAVWRGAPASTGARQSLRRHGAAALLPA